MSAKTTGGPAKPRKSDDGVLASLSSTRPNKLGRRSRAETTRATTAKTKPARPEPTAAKPPEPKPVAAMPAPAATTRPKAVRAGAPKLKAPAERPQEPKSTQQTGTELVSTVVQAAGELAQIGLTVSRQILKRAVDRFPRP